MLDLLQRLAEGGYRAVSFDRWRDLANWCWDYAEASGDARYCSLARGLGTVASAFDEYGVLDTTAVQRIDHSVQTQLPEVLARADPADATILARTLREDLARAVRLPPGGS